MQITEKIHKNYSFTLDSLSGGKITLNINAESEEDAKEKLTKDLEYSLKQLKEDDN